MQNIRLLRSSFARFALCFVGAILLVHSYASNVSVSNVALQDQYGLAFNVPSAFTAIDQGFSNITLTQTPSNQPCTWINGTLCQTALTSSHLEFSVQLILNNPPSQLTNYTLTVTWSQNGGSSEQIGQLAVSISALAHTGEWMTFQYDTGTTSLSGPMSLDVTVS